MKSLANRIKDKTPVLADGAMGTLLHQWAGNVPCLEMLNIENPDIVARVAREYYEAGAEIIQANTFGASPVRLAQRQLEHKCVEINKAAIENDGILIIGSVEPHYFAGYTGGRKAIMPGIASYKSIEMNHHLALSEDARALELEKNPVHQDMVDTLSLLKDSHIFSIQCVMDSDHNIYEVQCGDIIESFDSAIEAADEVFTVNVEKKYDVVISVAKHPMDIDLYQSQKAMDNSKGILKENGILILVAACHEGKGPETFYNLIASSASPVNAINRINHSYKLGYHKAAKMAEMMRHFSVYAVSELSESVLKNIFMSKFDTLEDALNEALRIKGENSDVAIIRDGCVTVPVVRK